MFFCYLTIVTHGHEHVIRRYSLRELSYSCSPLRGRIKRDRLDSIFHKAQVYPDKPQEVIKDPGSHCSMQTQQLSNKARTYKPSLVPRPPGDEANINQVKLPNKKKNSGSLIQAHNQGKLTGKSSKGDNLSQGR